MLSIYPDNADSFNMPVLEDWATNDDYFPDADWVVVYQRNQHNPIQTLFTGSKNEAIQYFDDFIESWG